MLEALQGFADGVGHGDVNVIARVNPFDGETAVIDARWVNSDVVIISEGFEEVGGVVGIKLFDYEGINSEGEDGRQGGVFPNNRGV